MKNHKGSEGKFNIIMESINTDITVAELCRKYGITSSVYRECRSKFFESAKNELAGNNTGKALEMEQLKQMADDQAMVIDVFKKNLRREEKVMAIMELNRREVI